MPSQTPPPVTTEELLEQAGWLRSLARRLARDAAGADDLTQGVLMRALEQPPRSGRPLRPWLHSVLQSLSRRTQRSEARRFEREYKAAKEEAQAPKHDALEQFEEQRLLADLVARLEEPYRTVIVRRFYTGESAAQMAKDSKIPAATIRSQIARGLARLRELHTEAHGDDSTSSLAALGLAAGLPTLDSLVLGSASASATSTSTSLAAASAPTHTGPLSILAMNTTTKLATSVVIPVLLLATWFGLRDNDPVREASPNADSPEPVVQVESEAQSTSDELAKTPKEGRNEVSTATKVSEPEINRTEQPAITSIGLQVTDKQGHPISGALLSLLQRTGAPLPSGKRQTSAPTGRIQMELEKDARIPGFSEGEWTVYLKLEAPGYATLFLNEAIDLDKKTELGRRTMLPGASVQGRVLDASGSTLADIEIVAKPGGAQPLDNDWDVNVQFQTNGPTSGELLIRTTTDEFGHFNLEGLSAQSTNLWFRMPARPWNVSAPFDLQPNEQRSAVELIIPKLDPKQQVLGRVLRPDGSAAAGAQIRSHWGGFWKTEEQVADAAGRFSIVPQVGRHLQLMAFDPEERYGCSKATQVEPGDPEFILQLAQEQRLQVRVQDSAGNGLPQSYVSLSIADNYMGNKRTDESGQHAQLVPADPFSLYISSPGFARQELGPFYPNALPKELVVQLERERVARGVVLHRGQPVPGARVFLMRNIDELYVSIYKDFPEGFQSQGAETQTDEEGEFTIPISSVYAGSCALLVEKPGYARAQVILPQPDSALAGKSHSIELTRGGTLEGFVNTPASVSKTGVVVALSRFDGRPITTRTDDRGFYRIENLTPGPWRVEDRHKSPRADIMSMTLRDDVKFEPNVVITEAGTTVFNLDTRWQENLTLDGRLRFNDKAAQAWSARLREGEYSFSEWSLPPATLDAGGHFQAPAQPGPVRLLLESPVENGVIRKLEHNLNLRFKPEPFDWNLATGRLAGSGETPGARLRVSIDLERGGRFITLFQADETGSYAVRGLPAGPSNLRRYEDAVHGLGWYRQVDFTVIAGELKTLNSAAQD